MQDIGGGVYDLRGERVDGATGVWDGASQMYICWNYIFLFVVEMCVTQETRAATPAAL